MTSVTNFKLLYIPSTHCNDYKLHFFFSHTTPDAKRLIGRKFDDAVVQSDMKHWPFKVVNDSGKPKMEVEYKGEIKTFYPEEVSSMVLTKMKEISEAYLGKVWSYSQLEEYISILKCPYIHYFKVIPLKHLIISPGSNKCSCHSSCLLQ